jgi:hypothetical protein
MRFTISADGYKKQGRTKIAARMFVTACRFADGDGYRVKSISYASDATKAATFSRAAAEAIAEQYKFSLRNIRIDSPASSIAIAPTPAELEARRALAEDFARANAIIADGLRYAIGRAING